MIVCNIYISFEITCLFYFFVVFAFESIIARVCYCCRPRKNQEGRGGERKKKTELKKQKTKKLFGIGSGDRHTMDVWLLLSVRNISRGKDINFVDCLRTRI